jgi:hypothetical protein
MATRVSSNGYEQGFYIDFCGRIGVVSTLALVHSYESRFTIQDAVCASEQDSLRGTNNRER